MLLFLLYFNTKEVETACIDAFKMLIFNNESTKKNQEINSSYQRRQAPSDWPLVA